MLKTHTFFKKYFWFSKMDIFKNVQNRKAEKSFETLQFIFMKKRNYN